MSYPDNRKIVQVATIPAYVFDDPRTETRTVVTPAVLALCDDGTFWALSVGHPREAKWEPTLPIPAGWGPPAPATPQPLGETS